MERKNSEHPKSIWSASVKLPEFQRLKTDIKTQVLIIGGGMAGILCAHMLKEAGVDYVLAEADTICSGITKNTTAKITFQHGLIYHKLIHSLGNEKAAMYLDVNRKALNKYTELCAGIDCDFEKKDAFVYSLDNPKLLSQELKALQRLDYPAQLAQDLPLPFPTAGAVKFTGQAQFHPLKFIRGIAPNLNIYEHTMVKELEGGKARTDKGTITAEKIIVATHFPFLNKHGSYFLKMYQHRSYVIALEHGPDLKGMYVDQAQKGMSFRNHQGLLFIGGAGHRTGKPGGNWEELGRFAAGHYPDARIKYRWAAQDCMTLDGIPYIGNYSKNTPNLYAATGFNKWGMTSSMVCAMALADLVMDRKNPWAALFSPSRSILKPQLALNALEAAKNQLTLSRPRCPHQGCALKWNPWEHSWDCPCHGSRFDRYGHLIDNPATGDLKSV